MTSSDSATSHVRSKVARAAAVTGLVAAAVAVAAPAAMAGGTSSNINGCYSTWGSTGSSAHCSNVTQHAAYRNEASCSWSPDQQSTFHEFFYGDSNSNWGQVDCTFKINSSWISVSFG